jgi:hypothetical protein
MCRASADLLKAALTEKKAKPGGRCMPIDAGCKL